MRDKDTPLRLVRKWAKMAPDCYSELDRCHSAKAEGQMHWPDWCELPISAAYTYLVCRHGATDQSAAAGASELTACWIWRRNKVLYAFDPDLSSALTAQAEDMTDTDSLPADLLMYLPYPSIYIKSSLWEDSDGFWSWLEFDQDHPDIPELRLQWVTRDMEHSVGTVLHLVPGGTIRDCVLSTAGLAPNADDMVEAVPLVRLQLAAIQHLLYLVSAQADVQDQPAPVRVKQQAGRPTIIQDKAGEVQAKDVGIRIGAALRAGRKAAASGVSTGTGSAKRPHARRGHWHHYWSGPKDARKLILKWTAPTFVHPEAGQEDNIVLFPVKK